MAKELPVPPQFNTDEMPARFSSKALALVGIPLAFLAWWLFPMALTSQLNVGPVAKIGLENALRDTLAKAMWAALTLWAGYLLWRNLQQISQVAEHGAQTLAMAERTAYFAAQAGETERYAGAMKLLGSEQVEVRLGGIYALERLARESKNDHGPIMEVLSATYRAQSSWISGETVAARLNADLQAILTVIGRRHAPFDPSEGHIDLHGCSLARGYLPNANLSKAFLYESNLEGAILQNADLRGAWMWKANLRNATLDGAQLHGADLTGAEGLSSDQLKVAHYDSTTKFPEYLRSDLFDGVKSAQQRTKIVDEAPTSEDLKIPSRRG